MNDESPYHALGAPLPGPQALMAPLAGRAFAACREDRRFAVVELRRIEGERPADVIVVDCKNDRVPSKNARGIEYIERLALLFGMDRDHAPEVRALRKDFPATDHQNGVGPGEPAWLCLYFEPWPAVARSWTGRRFLERIIVWLGDIAASELHRADQPVENLYFTAPWELVLPALVRENGVPSDQILAVRSVDAQPQHKALLLSELHPRGQPVNGAAVSAVVIEVLPVVSGTIERPPHTLGELADQLQRRGSDLLRPLISGLNELANGAGVPGGPQELGLLIVRVPVKRQADGPVETFQVVAFLVEKGLGAVGEALGTLRRDVAKQRYFRFALVLGHEPQAENEAWKNLVIDQLAVLDALDRGLAHRVTDVVADKADFPGALIGAGSLGSALGDLWGREAWGRWSIIDDDLLKPHNVPRHRAFRSDIGKRKAFLVARMIKAAAPEDVPEPTAIVGDALSGTPEVTSPLERADLIVDASTTLHVPRALTRASIKARCTSVFFTPSGKSAVILLEDRGRSIRLDTLEAQYYRAILRSDWGATHLAGHRAREFWIGAGCREVSTVLSPELVAQHSGLLARRLRLLNEQAEAAIRVWEHDDTTGAVRAHAIPVAPALTVSLTGWQVQWDEAVQRKVRELRASALPNETGGVLVGYVDQVDRVIQVVDVTPPPPDSAGSAEGFERGLSGVESELARIADRTAGIVGYVGEWHSHPDGASAVPSTADYSQLLYLTRHLRDEGLPALILIVGEESEGFAVGDVIE